MFQANLISADHAVMPKHPESPAVRAILDAIEQADGAITYERFMELSMYGHEGGQGYGFYSSGRANINGDAAQRDFPTHAANPAFGMSIAHYGREMWAAVAAPKRLRVVEMGAGDGAQAQWFMYEINRQAATSDEHDTQSFANFKRALGYTILEYGRGMIDQQRNRLHSGVSWIHGSAIDLPLAPARPAQGAPASEESLLLISNELPDTFPVALVVKEGEMFTAALKEVYVRATNRGALYEALGPLSSETLERQAQKADNRYPMQPGALRVFNLRAQRWARNMGRVFQGRTGGILMVDYGNASEIMDLPPRLYHRSVRSPYGGQNHEQAMHRLQYELPGEVDITTSVPFGAIDRVLRTYGLKSHYAEPETIFLQKYGYAAHEQHAPASYAATATGGALPRSFMAYSYIKL